jgi:UDP-3-O-[3-hydroxymyristoyl] glucosamine N-acyltransferase
VVQEATVNGHAVIGKIEYVEQAFLNKEFDELLIGIGYKHLLVRKKLFDQYSGKIPFGKIVHSSCWVDGSAIIKEGAILYPRCIIDARAIVETNTILNLGCTLAHDSIVGGHSFLSPNVSIAGFVRIGERCNFGIAAVVIDNLAITATTQLGGGAVVTQNIDIAGLYVGMPAKFVRSY